MGFHRKSQSESKEVSSELPSVSARAPFDRDETILRSLSGNCAMDGDAAR
jgi:hypothetical protein